MIWFLLGGLVAVVALVGYVVLGGRMTADIPAEGDSLSINVESPVAPTADPAPDEAAPGLAPPAE
jgi:hypothetical protein